jgi:molybdopterin-containing oxidoreductase family iron-sulfur binding subunit
MRYWKGLAEHADSPEFRERAAREFPPIAEPPSRRSFLKYLGASAALMGLAGCRRKDHRILPYAAKPPEMTPGLPLYYATTFVLGGRAMGVLAETHEGRPTKLEGNPNHPASGGALNAFAQASILDLYDPSLDYASPAMEMLRERMPGMSWYVHEPLGTAGITYELSGVEVIVSLDSDFLGLEDDGVRYKQEFAAGRRAEAMSRLYVVEPHLTVTGMAADQRLAMRASGIPEFALALGTSLLDGKTSTDRRARAIADDLRRKKGRAVIVAGRRQPVHVQALVTRMNEWLDARPSVGGRTVPGRTTRELAESIRAGEVRSLLILGANPGYDASPELGFPDLLKRVETTIHLGLRSWGAGPRSRSSRGSSATRRPTLTESFGRASALTSPTVSRRPDGGGSSTKGSQRSIPRPGWRLTS